jgi:hypothetical protein
MWNRAPGLLPSLLLAILAPVPAAAVTSVACVAGNCRDGQGTSRSSEGHEFTGQFALAADPFLGRPVSVMQSGTYTDARTGRRYEGEFNFIPAKIGGYYIFQGARIDDELDEVTRGLFASDKVNFGGQQIIFHRARVDYIEQLRSEFDASVAQFKVDQQLGRERDAARAAELEAGQSRGGGGLSMLLGVVGGLAQIGGVNLRGLQGNALSGIAGVVTGRQSTGSVLEGVASQLLQQVSGNAGLAKALGNPTSTTAVLSGLSALGKTAAPMSRAEYAASGGGGLGNVLNAVGGALVRQSGNLIGNALGSADLGVAGQLVGNLAQQGMSNLAARVETADPRTGVLGPAPGAAGTASGAAGQIVGSVAQQSINRISEKLGEGRIPPPPAPSPVPAPVPSTSKPLVSAGQPGLAVKPQGPAHDQATAPGSASADAPPADAPKILTSKPRRPPRHLDLEPPVAFAAVASMDVIEAPDGITLSGGQMYATNDGVYMSARNGSGKNVVAKYAVHREDPKDPKMPFMDRWLTAEIGTTFNVEKTGPGSFAIGSFRFEDPGEMNFTWITYGGYYGYGPELITPYYHRVNDAHVVRFIPQVSTPGVSKFGNNMAIASDSKVYYEKSGGGSGEKFLDRYVPVDVGGNGLRYDLAVMSEKGFPSYVAGADMHSLFMVWPGGWKRFELNGFGEGMVHTVLFADHRVWIGYGDKILWLDRLDKLQLFATMEGGGFHGGPAFCVSGIDLYMANGFYYNGLDSGSRLIPYLQIAPHISQDDLKKVSAMKSALMLGVYCADDVNGPRLYSAGLVPDEGLEMKLFLIRPKYGGESVGRSP